jgi:hypothetical protein
VTWSTQLGSGPMVKYGKVSRTYTKQQFGTYSTYAASDMCNQPASAWGYSSPGVINTAVLQGLEPNTTYFYTYGQEVRTRRCVSQSFSLQEAS